jgi:RND family efflux transporter MFP subunit
MADVAKPAPHRLRERLGELWAPSRPRLGEILVRARARPWRTAVVLLAAVGSAAAAASLLRSEAPGPVVAVQRGTLRVRLVETGTLRPSASITYRSPLAGRETEVTFLAPEGLLVGEGDLIAALDASELQRELERATQDLRQAELDVRTAEMERAEGAALVDSVAQGAGALAVEETRSALRLAERKVERLRQTRDGLAPLLDQGFITREELDRADFDLEQAEAELALARKKAEVYVQRTHPRENQRARLQLAQKDAQLANAQARVREAAGRVQGLGAQIEGSRIYARAPGIVVYEEYLGAGTRRKIRVGDRVTASHGLVTIPEVQRMVVESSVREADVHRVRAGQAATVRLDAFPDVVLKGRVSRVGTLARAAPERVFEDKRFDLVVELDAAPGELRPEMTARVDVLVDERKDVLLVPVAAVFEEGGAMVCRRRGPFGTETRRVEVGETDEQWVEVRSGLREGDHVVLAGAEVGPAPPAAAAPIFNRPALAPERGLGPR